MFPKINPRVLLPKIKPRVLLPGSASDSAGSDSAGSASASRGYWEKLKDLWEERKTDITFVSVIGVITWGDTWIRKLKDMSVNQATKEITTQMTSDKNEILAKMESNKNQICEICEKMEKKMTTATAPWWKFW